MPTKTERILSYLPHTMRSVDRRSALRAVAAAPGDELQGGENTLAAIMRAHWVDTADFGVPRILDLALIASLYGLAPQSDEPAEEYQERYEGFVEKLNTASGVRVDGLSPRALETVEEFRERLLRYIRTQLDGTVTVEGILRVAADALGVRAAVGKEHRDSWWQRPQDSLTLRERRGDDAADALFGRARHSQGNAAQPARITGTVPLAGGADLRGHAFLVLDVDGVEKQIDLAPGAADIAAVPLDHLCQRINSTFPGVASHDGRLLTLTSPTAGPTSRLAFGSSDEDAVPFILGLAPHQYNGRNAQPARLPSQDLSQGVDLTHDRFLRLTLDDAGTHEIDCGGGLATLDEVKDKINAAVGGAPIARRVENRLVLESRTKNARGRLFLQEPAAQSAAPILFGQRLAFGLGDDDRPAVLKSAPAATTLDLSQKNLLRLRLDDRPPVTIDCAGEKPSETTLAEVAARINTATGAEIAVTDGASLTLTSAEAGRDGQLAIESAGEADAKAAILGLPPREFFGVSALPAVARSRKLVREAGDPGDFEPFTVAARRYLRLAVDGAAPVLIDLQAGVQQEADYAPAPEKLVEIINQALHADIASTDGRFVTLTSPTKGPNSRVDILPLETVTESRFVSRAMLLGEAAEAVFGFPRQEAGGQAPTQARLAGTADLREGADLRENRWLNISIDGRPPVTIDCAGPRPRTTTIPEIVANVNTALKGEYLRTDGKRLLLVSPREGEGSSVELHPVRAEDALPVLFALDPQEAAGSDARRVLFTGTVDLSAGVELPGGASVRLAVDDQLARDIVLNPGLVPARKQLTELAALINFGLGAVVAFRDGNALALRSPAAGAKSRLAWEVPSTGADATRLVFGITAPRAYQGDDARPAELRGKVDLPAELELGTKYLALAADGAAPRSVKLTGKMKPAAIAASINDQLGKVVAFVDGARLVLRSPHQGSGSRLRLEAYVSRDAREALFGKSPQARVDGLPALPAQLTGTVDLLQPVNLTCRGKLLLAVDQNPPEEIDISGNLPRATTLEEMVAKINAVIPGLASATVDDRLRLTSPTAGADSRVAVLPRRFFDLIEFSETPREKAIGPVTHGGTFELENEGTGEEALSIEIRSLLGVPGLTLVNETEQIRIHIGAVIGPGETLLMEPGRTGPGVTVMDRDGHRRPIPGSGLTIQTLQPGTSAAPLLLARGPSQWRYLECLGPRFNQASFDHATFAGGSCREAGIFNVSQLPQVNMPVFAASPPAAPHVALTFRWTIHSAGGFTLRLPAELPERFGGRFNQARFAGAPVTLRGVVISPKNDPAYLRAQLQASGFPLKVDDDEGAVRIGFTPARLPFRKPRYLTGGDEQNPARLYLTVEGLDHVILLEADAHGAWGNQISVSARIDGPGRYEFQFSFEGARFESARALVLGPRLNSLAHNLFQPGPLGVLQAKAAGVRARVIRESTPETDSQL